MPVGRVEIGAKWKTTIEYADFRILFLLLSLDYHSIQVFDFREIIICHLFERDAISQRLLIFLPLTQYHLFLIIVEN